MLLTGSITDIDQDSRCIKLTTYDSRTGAFWLTITYVFLSSTWVYALPSYFDVDIRAIVITPRIFRERKPQARVLWSKSSSSYPISDWPQISQSTRTSKTKGLPSSQVNPGCMDLSIVSIARRESYWPDNVSLVELEMVIVYSTCLLYIWNHLDISICFCKF